MKRKERKGIWIPQSILKLDLNGNDKILLAEIYSLCERKNGCYASNQHFANLIGYETAGAASKRLTFLAKKGFIRTKLVYDGKRCVGRHIYRNDIMNSLMGIVPNDTNGADIGNQGVVPNEPKGISAGNTTNSSRNNSVLINSGTSTHTGVNMVEEELQIKERPAHLQPSVTTGFQKFKKQKEEAAAFLVNATEIGAQIFEFDNQNKFQNLQNKIGYEAFQKIKPALLNFIEAKKWLR